MIKFICAAVACASAAQPPVCSCWGLRTPCHPGTRALFALLCCFSLASTATAAETITPAELAIVKQAEAARTAIIENIYGTVVAIYGNDRQGGGSGFLFDPAGYALTNHHVVAGAGSEGWAGLADGRLYRWHLIGTDPGGDVAIIRLTGQDAFPVARLGLSDTVRVGDWMLAVGNPFTLAEDQTPTVTLGIVSGIGRYQAGAGKNTLVYGNCIQIDSSVNPGNSGGPAFDMTGRVIGINGRISAMERGRVNVGLGYAISMEQIRNFIPDLLATKVVQHGTLDAQFSTRGGVVVCSALNIDSPIARAGIKLGDRLVSFNGTPIDDVNVFTNLSTLYPAGWPVEVVFEHAGKQHTAHVRLTALPYEIQPAPETPAPDGQPPEGEAPMPADPEAEKPLDEKPGDSPLDEEPKKEGERPQPKPGDKPRVVQAPRGLQLLTQGEVRDKALNKGIAKLLMARARQSFVPVESAPGAHVDPMEILDDVLQQGQVIGTHRLIIDSSGRFYLSWKWKPATGKQAEGTITFDGLTFRQLGVGEGKTMTELDAADALQQPLVVQAYALASFFPKHPWSAWAAKKVQLAGGDVAQKQRAYRLTGHSLNDLGEVPFHVWLSMFDENGDALVRLLKAGLDPDASTQRPAMIFDDWRAAAKVVFPHRRAIVTGLAENVQLEFVAREVKPYEGSLDKLLENKP